MNKIILKLSQALCLTLLSMQISFAAGNWWDIATSSSYYNTNNTNTNTNTNTSATVIIPTTNNTSLSNNQNLNTNTQTNSSANVTNTNMLVQGDSNSNTIRDDVDLVVSDMVTRYNLTQPQKRSIEQIARSYQYVLMFAPNTVSSAYQANLRDVAATKCAEQRLPAAALDLVVERIESASLNTQDRKNTYDRYINLIDESSAAGAPAGSFCEDEFSGSLTDNNSNSNTSNNNVVNIPNTNNSNTNITNNNQNSGLIKNMPCLVLNQFMEQGSNGQQVTMLQTFLLMNNTMSVWPTGYFAANTKSAVKNFQAAHGIDNSNGWVGPSTRAKIAELTCNGDRNFIEQARRGYTLKAKSYVAPIKKSSAKPVVYAKPKPQIYTERKVIEISTTTTQSIATYTPDTYNTNTNLSAVLSNTSGTFDTSINPIKALYFTVKADAKRDDLYICPERKEENNCLSGSGYILVKQKYDPLSYDSIASGDRWIFNIYYNSSLWGTAGGKIYFKNGTGGVPSVYSVNVR